MTAPMSAISPPPARFAQRLRRLLPAGVVLAAAVFAGMFFFTALPRLVYPYDLDFIEDGILMQALRVAQGLPVYVAPNADFNPHVYMPLFFWLGGALVKIFGPHMWLLRGLSFAATLVTAAVIFYVARRESRQAWVGAACAGLFLAGYPVNGFWYRPRPS